MKSSFHWIALFAYMTKHIQACEDSVPERESVNWEGTWRVMLYSTNFLGGINGLCNPSAGCLPREYSAANVIPKEMRATVASGILKAFGENVFRRFGAPSLTRHERDLGIMSEVFQIFSKLIMSKSRTSLSYRFKQTDSKNAAYRRWYRQRACTSKIILKQTGMT